MASQHVVRRTDHLYKAGFIYGYYSLDAEWEKYFNDRNSISAHWNPEEFEGLHEYELGVEDGAAQRELDLYSEFSIFFGFDIAGFPWGSNLELSLRGSYWGDEQGSYWKDNDIR